MKPKFLLIILFLLPFLSACNDTDDVGRIFTGKTWKLTYITAENTNEMFDFWNGDKSAKTVSTNILNQSNNYTLTFTGTEDKQIITGSFNGNVIKNIAVSGDWTADGESNKFSISKFKSSGSDSDKLAIAYIDGLQNADSYSGDENNLYLYFTYEQIRLRLVFAPKKN